MSELKTFELFNNLPYEIHLRIWEIASPRRIIYLWELSDEEVAEYFSRRDGDEPLDTDMSDYDHRVQIREINERLKEAHIELELHLRQTQLHRYGFTSDLFPTPAPMVSREWEFQRRMWLRDGRLEQARQTALCDPIVSVSGDTGFGKKQVSLERFGFTSSLRDTGMSLRRVPGHLIAEEARTTVFQGQLGMDGIPIPTRVCKESRQALRNIGFDLAFGPRTSLPTTWFNFRSDYLCTFKAERPLDAGHHGDYCDFNRLLPEDLCRVKKLMFLPLDLSPYSDSDSPGQSQDLAPQQVSAIRKFGNLEELLIVLDWREYDDHGRLIYDNYELFIEDFELINAWSEVRRTPCTCKGHEHDPKYLRTVREFFENPDHGGGLTFYEKKAAFWEAKLRDQLERDVAEGATPYSVPKLRWMYVTNRKGREILEATRLDWRRRAFGLEVADSATAAPSTSSIDQSNISALANHMLLLHTHNNGDGNGNRCNYCDS